MDGARAIIMCMIYGAMVDGKFSEIEKIRIEGIVKYYPIFDKYSPSLNIDNEVNAFHKLSSEKGSSKEILLYLKDILAHDNLLNSAYAFTLEIISCDMHINHDEIKLINNMGDIFELSENSRSKLDYSRKVRYLFD